MGCSTEPGGLGALASSFGSCFFCFLSLSLSLFLCSFASAFVWRQHAEHSLACAFAAVIEMLGKT